MNARDIKKIAVCGAGTIGGGFAAYFSLKGLAVNVLEQNEESILYAKQCIQEPIDSYIKHGLADSAEDIWSRINITTDPGVAFTDVFFVQENCPENLEIKHKMIDVMEKHMPPEGIIASSSSGFTASSIAEKAKHPERIIVGHPFNPAYLLPLIEICAGEKTSPEVVEVAREFYKLHDKAPVVMNKEKRGFIANRLMHALWREEIALVCEGVCSMADADDAWTFGPGLRLAAFGPAMNYELGGGDLGLRGCAIKFGAMTNSVFEDISDMKSVPDIWPDLSGDEIGPLMENLPEVIGNEKPIIAAFRDNTIIELLKLHKKM